MQRREFLRNLGFVVPGLAITGWQPLIEKVWAAEAPIDLVKNDTSKSVIVIGKNAAPPERHASDELRTYLKKVAGVDVPIVTEGVVLPTQFPIYLGTPASCPGDRAIWIADEGKWTIQ